MQNKLLGLFDLYSLDDFTFNHKLFALVKSLTLVLQLVA